MRIRQRHTSGMERPKHVTGLELDFGLVWLEFIGPLTVGALQRKKARNILLNQIVVAAAIDIGEREGLIAEIGDVLDFAGGDPGP